MFRCEGRFKKFKVEFIKFNEFCYICSPLKVKRTINHKPQTTNLFAQMAKLVDALPSGGSVRKDVQVRILFWALFTRLNNIGSFFIYIPCLHDRAGSIMASLFQLAFLTFSKQIIPFFWVPLPLIKHMHCLMPCRPHVVLCNGPGEQLLNHAKE